MRGRNELNTPGRENHIQRKRKLNNTREKPKGRSKRMKRKKGEIKIKQKPPKI